MTNVGPAEGGGSKEREPLFPEGADIVDAMFPKWPKESLAHKLSLVWTSRKGGFVCACGWKAKTDIRVSITGESLANAAWLGVEVGKEHARHLMEVQESARDASIRPHRSPCPGCGHPECDAKKNAPHPPPTMRPPMLIALEEIRDYAVVGKPQATVDILKSIATAAIAEAKKQPSKT